ncbi:PucR family transcriptional regulator ligand-binding domain-containing protein [Microbacterium esteraromaticum]|uniref:PucR family transcriptional regulator ligand-binding domain-containing protein n=1 Tax=Microbacterium esteraromaticum TaxID=57043 RepID=A0A939ITV4_9MICO|nr:PucR family transcriptional regulator ligand-binding domain-containing protein [Microbacterium esteraromaticum]MBN8414508.1 PucR family transcriptional regulator ligand-binding domain-containing protein [Microbacterium esteraromaticum]
MRDVLRVDALQRGAPEVLVGGEALDARVRWVHVSDSDQVADLLDGGELLLTTAAGWAGADAALHDLADRLAGAGVAGVVIELGTRFTVAPPAFIAACRARGLALIALERVVKFVTVTEAVHRRIISGQLEALQERQRLHELFTGLSLRGAPADVVVRETARVLDAPIVLETPGREVVTAEVRDVRASDVLTGWAARSRSDVELLTVPVQARGVRWGALVALPGAEHPAGALTVLELAATALAFARLADGPTAWEVLPARDLVQAIAGGGHSGDADVAARMAAAGLPVVGRALGVLVVPRAQPGQVQRLVEALTATDARNAGADTRAMGAVHDGDGVVLVSSRRKLSSAQIFAAAAGLSTGLAIGTPASTVAELLASVRPARLLAARLGPAEVRRVDDRPLTRLVTELGGDHRLQEHSERMLAPLIRFDEQHGGDLLRVLRAVVAHPGSRTAAAASSHLSRSVFYQRLTLISDLLDADLDDGETLAALHLAVLTLPVR